MFTKRKYKIITSLLTIVEYVLVQLFVIMVFNMCFNWF